ncbi:Succinate dehydrogenase assembly factor 2, mitochondrial [Hordeum vulgare]|nr:Succinate dehydrogenase assembly factor 2, mitochondrial [Hordeum vulgare]
MYRRKQRGFLELDLVLGTWVEQHVRSMDEANIRSLLQILDLVSHPALPDPSSFHRSTAHIVVSIHTQWADLGPSNAADSHEDMAQVDVDLNLVESQGDHFPLHFAFSIFGLPMCDLVSP